MSRLSRFGFIDARKTSDPVRKRIRSRGVPTALADREVFYTEDVAEASELIGRALAPCRLTLSGFGANGFAASMHGVRFRAVSLLYLDLHVPAEIDITASGKYFCVHMPTNGRAVGTVAGHDFEINTVKALVTNPKDELRIRFDHDSPQLLVRVEQEALERYLTRLTGRMMTGDLVFEPEFDLTSDVAMRWHGAIQLMHAEVYYTGSLVHHGHGIGPLEDMVMSSLLLIQPSTYRMALTHPNTAPGRRPVRRAVEFIEQNLSRPLTMAEIADHVGASVRSIQQGFHDELGTTPMAYLRDQRLERAHAELSDAQVTDGVTVTHVAEHWGFNHLGSFATMYRKRWGESPSDTLRA